jgi:hypothetical protein
VFCTHLASEVCHHQVPSRFALVDMLLPIPIVPGRSLLFRSARNDGSGKTSSPQGRAEHIYAFFGNDRRESNQWPAQECHWADIYGGRIVGDSLPLMRAMK